MRVLIIDDELKGREILEYYLSEFHSECQIIGMCENVDEAVKIVREKTPELIFLDVHIPGGSGFDLFDRVNLKDCMVVFVTGHQEYAQDAFKVSAFDYLTKPVSNSEITRVLTKAKENLLAKELSISPDQKKIRLKVSTSYKMLDPAEIVYLESEGNYTTIFLENNDSFVISKPIKRLQQDHFSHFPFLRIHQSYIINLNHVKEFDNSTLELSCLKRINISRSKYPEFIAAIEKM